MVNVLGSFGIGLFVTLTAPDGRLFVSTETRHFFIFGLFGGFTTFSSFSVQTLNLLRAGEWLEAATNVFGSVAICLMAVWFGHILAMSFNQLRG
jgi:CrcB protein